MMKKNKMKKILRQEVVISELFDYARETLTEKCKVVIKQLQCWKIPNRQTYHKNNNVTN